MNDTAPSQDLSAEENQMLQFIDKGPVLINANHFEEVLTVPPELRQRVFYWPEEKLFCERISSIGRALDTLTTIHRAFLGQFKLLSSVRAGYIHAPTEYFVAPMYFCDRALDSLLRSTRIVQNNIAELFNDLSAVESECFCRHSWTKKAFLENKYPKHTAAHEQSGEAPDMDIKEKRVELLAELAERIRTVRKGGSNVFAFLGRPWLHQHQHDTNLRASPGAEVVSNDMMLQKENHRHDKEYDTVARKTHDRGYQPTADLQNEISAGPEQAREQGKVGEVPETPEVNRTGGVVKTQRSLQRRRKPSQSSGGTADTENCKQVDFVTRNLMADGSVPLRDSPAHQFGSSAAALHIASQTAAGAPMLSNPETLSDARIEPDSTSREVQTEDQERPQSLSI